jgi:hypothetical protein
MKRPRCQYWQLYHSYCKKCVHEQKGIGLHTVMDWMCKGHLSICPGYVPTKYIEPRGKNA